MKAAEIHAPGDIRVTDVPYPKLGAVEVIVKIHACGICGSDLPRALGDGAHFYPVVVGHEAAGEIVEVGSEVTGFRVGDRVAIAPLVPCMNCEACQQGQYSLCKQYSFIGSRRQGCMAEYVAVPGKCLLPLPKSLSYEKAAMVEPATVSLYGLLKCGTLGGLRVGVLGTGTIGLFAVQWAKFLGAVEVIAIDTNDRKLEKALELGADTAINSADLGSYQKESLEAIIDSVTEGDGIDLVVETAGVPLTQVQSVELAANGGKVLYVGTAHRDVHFPARSFEAIVRKELSLFGSWMSYSAPFPGREWKLAVKALSDGRIRAVELITHQFELARVKEAFETLYSCKDAVKVMLVG